jgi:ketosteroid isomerase-like protein
MKQALVLTIVLAFLAPSLRAETNEELKEQVRQAEIAFAKSMADRDHAAFMSFLADEAVFFGRGVQRGKASVAAAWKPFYDAKQAPFSWGPETVEVLDSGTLGYSSGPVLSPSGQRVGTFNSIWRREKDGRWKIIFDKGCPPCDCAAASPKPGL